MIFLQDTAWRFLRYALGSGGSGSNAPRGTGEGNWGRRRRDAPTLGAWVPQCAAVAR